MRESEYQEVRVCSPALGISAGLARRLLRGEFEDDAYSRYTFAREVLESGFSAEEMGITNDDLERIKKLVSV